MTSATNGTGEYAERQPSEPRGNFGNGCVEEIRHRPGDDAHRRQHPRHDEIGEEACERYAFFNFPTHPSRRRCLVNDANQCGTIYSSE